jgi:hypothetical protein
LRHWSQRWQLSTMHPTATASLRLNQVTSLPKKEAAAAGAPGGMGGMGGMGGGMGDMDF